MNIKELRKEYRWLPSTQPIQAKAAIVGKHIGVRTQKQFKCSNQACGPIGGADVNGSKMIALVGLSVNQPRGSQLLACTITEWLPKALAF
ncbi:MULTISPECIES: hypothetical protein [unclassified Microcoleus]|uniref:hypothetical protein n=1 Tax=unclassified Microcoleus TaxID=2642155 RepID=UPI0025DC0C07|nr:MULTISPECIES: hypothetical protein [unclassified Microcoleus]